MTTLRSFRLPLAALLSAALLASCTTAPEKRPLRRPPALKGEYIREMDWHVTFNNNDQVACRFVGLEMGNLVFMLPGFDDELFSAPVAKISHAEMEAAPRHVAAYGEVGIPGGVLNKLYLYGGGVLFGQVMGIENGCVVFEMDVVGEVPIPGNLTAGIDTFHLENASRDVSGIIKPSNPSEEALEKRWLDLGGDDPRRSAEAYAFFQTGMDATVAFIKGKIRRRPDHRARVGELVRELDDPVWKKRETASRRLAGYGENAFRYLERICDNPNLTAEMKNRIEKIISSADPDSEKPASDEIDRTLLALMILENIASEEAWLVVYSVAADDNFDVTTVERVPGKDLDDVLSQKTSLQTTNMARKILKRMKRPGGRRDE